MILYHGTNRRIRNLRIGSFLTPVLQDAAHFADHKGGNTIYEFNVKEDEVERDKFTPFAEWYTTSKIINPTRVIYI